MSKKSFFSMFAVIALLMITANSCKEEEIAVKGVSLNPKTLSLMEGKTGVLVATINPGDAANKNVSWSSSDNEVATVKGGVVTAVKLGTAKITVTTIDGGYKDVCDVTVTRDVTGVKLDQIEVGLPLEEELILKAKIEPEGASYKKVEWTCSSDDGGKVELTSDSLECKVLAKELGNVTVTVTVKTESGEKTAECIIHVTAVKIDVADVELDLKKPYTLIVEESFNLTADVKPADATNKNVTWSSDPAGLVELEPNGFQCKVIGKAKGKATITVTTEDKGKTASCEVNVIVPGVDFSKAKVYNFSGDNKWEGYEYGPLAARWASMNLKHVVISGREQMPGGKGQPYIFELDDLKAGKTNNFTLMNRIGIWGGNSGAELNGIHLAHGRAYSCNMHSDLSTWPVRIYYWPDVLDPPYSGFIGSEGVPCLKEYMVPKDANWPIPGVDPGEDFSSYNLKLGDSMSVDIDENGNGYLFLMGRRMLCVGRIQVKNFTQLGDLKLDILPGFQSSAELGLTRPPYGYKSYHRVDGVQNEYIYSGTYELVRLVDRDGNKLYTMTYFSRGGDSKGEGGGCAARVINFNGARYLVTMDDAQYYGEATIAIYDITKGATTRLALENFDKSSDKAPKFTFTLGTLFVDDWGLAVSTDFAKDGDKKLYIVGSAAEAGFAIIELPGKE